MKVVRSRPKKEIIEKLNRQYGISELPYLLIKFGEHKLKLYSGNLSTEELYILDKNIKIENIGVHFADQEKSEIKLTLDGARLLKNQITKNILEINDKQAEDWLKGLDLDIQTERGIKVIKNNGELIGCGKSTGERITNSIPKGRRIR